MKNPENNGSGRLEAGMLARYRLRDIMPHRLFMVPATRVASFVRPVPELTIVPVIVSGVLSPAALHHPLTRLRRGECNREWLAANLQMLWPAPDDVTTNVTFGVPIRVETLRAGQSAGTAVKTQARQLMMAFARLD